MAVKVQSEHYSCYSRKPYVPLDKVEYQRLLRIEAAHRRSKPDIFQLDRVTKDNRKLTLQFENARKAIKVLKEENGKLKSELVRSYDTIQRQRDALEEAGTQIADLSKDILMTRQAHAVAFYAAKKLRQTLLDERKARNETVKGYQTEVSMVGERMPNFVPF